MIRIARQKFETIHFSAHDLRDPLPEGLPTDFDRIVSAYTFHHFTLEKKIDIIQGVFQHLNANGFLVIGDICFKNEAIRKAVKSRYVEDWEDEEYWCAEMDTSVLQKAGFSARVILQSDYLALLVIRKQ